MASLGLWTLPFCSLVSISPNEDSVNLQSGLNLSDVSVALHRFPSSHAPVFLGWHLNGVGLLPPLAATTTTVRQQGPPVGRRARGTWTATLDLVQKTMHLGATLLATQAGLNEYARDKRLGLLVLHSASCQATLQRGLLKPQQSDLFALPYASMLQFRQPRALHLLAQL